MSQKQFELGQDTGEALVRVARTSLDTFLNDQLVYHPDLASLPPELSQTGATFVTITNHGRLRGCIGNTEARCPLAQDAARNAISAATRDFRFPPVTPGELFDVRLEVTVLTPPSLLAYANYADLLAQLRPGLDGVILSSGIRKGLLLPQVWERLPDPGRFLEMIAMKAGIPPDELHLDPPVVTVETFSAHHYCEADYIEPGGSS